MPRQKKETYAVITPKNDGAKNKMEYHGDRWIFREETNSLKFTRDPGPWLVLISPAFEQVRLDMQVAKDNCVAAESAYDALVANPPLS